MAFNAARRMNSKIRNLKWYDIGVLKIDILAFAFLLGALFPVLVSAHRGWYVGIIVVCELYLMKRIFCKGGSCGCGEGCACTNCCGGDGASCDMKAEQEQDQQ